MRRRPLLQGALLLMGAGAFARATGTIFRMLLVRLAGSEALGLFQLVLPVYRLGTTLAGFRIPVALTKLTAERLALGDVEAARRVRTVSAALVLCCTAVASVLVVGAAPLVAGRLLTDPRTELLIKLLPLALIPSALTGIFRGYAEGRQTMLPTAAGQVVEQVVRVPAMLLLASLWLARGVDDAAAGLVVGMGLGEIAGLLTVAALCGWGALAARGPGARSPGARRLAPGPTFLVLDHLRVARQVTGLAFPLWVGSVINAVAQMVNASLIPRRLLAAGHSIRAATDLYGQLTGMVLPLLYMPMMLIFPVSTVLTPAIADRMAAGQHRAARAQLAKALLGAVGLGLTSSLIFWQFPELLGRLLYDAPQIAPLIRVLAAIAPFTYAGSIFAAVLYGLGLTGVLLRNFVLTTAVRLALIYWLTADPAWGIMGALWAVTADYALTAVLNGVAVWRRLRAA